MGARHIIEIPLYKTHVHFNVCESVDDMRQSILDIAPLAKGMTGVLGTTRAHSCRIDSGSSVALIVSVIDGSTRLSEIAHECLHIAWFILNRVNIKVDFDNQEALAYLQEYLINEITNIENRNVNKIK